MHQFLQQGGMIRAEFENVRPPQDGRQEGESSILSAITSTQLCQYSLDTIDDRQGLKDGFGLRSNTGIGRHEGIEELRSNHRSAHGHSVGPILYGNLLVVIKINATTY
jgi:hypothetical protein